MIEQRDLTPREADLRAAIGDSGIGLHRGGMHWDPFHPTIGVFARDLTPMIAIWHESEAPTPQEIETIVAIGKEQLERGLFHPACRN